MMHWQLVALHITGLLGLSVGEGIQQNVQAERFIVNRNGLPVGGLQTSFQFNTPTRMTRQGAAPGTFLLQSDVPRNMASPMDRFSSGIVANNGNMNFLGNGRSPMNFGLRTGLRNTFSNSPTSAGISGGNVNVAPFMGNQIIYPGQNHLSGSRQQYHRLPTILRGQNVNQRPAVLMPTNGGVIQNQRSRQRNQANDPQRYPSAFIMNRTVQRVNRPPAPTKTGTSSTPTNNGEEIETGW